MDTDPGSRSYEYQITTIEPPRLTPLILKSTFFE